ncbi:BlaI/MecI/CopY family transcriptional regulator [Actinomadura darangshiensis]|uniref:BlaI/MecI/CopY family transcriptional regulator n=1 Tax=Actinomadura darangshiensis TaxID=705336 RepID=A0A4R5B6K0_9ACTN|nr:BlaI/MecI/CopY family transcriptional regulator [Actinomadura darangshiensis]TDD81918.1 BlaI/MecI/CopY family transcriptional regulator [Actinomadura darangshiensis]
MASSDERGRRPAGMLEDAVLAALWDGARPMSPADVQAVLDGSPAYTTVMTTLARLARKGFATRWREGRGFVYSASVDEAGHTAAAMHELLGRRSDRAAVLARFVSELAPGDEALLHRLLRDAATDVGDETP